MSKIDLNKYNTKEELNRLLDSVKVNFGDVLTRSEQTSLIDEINIKLNGGVKYTKEEVYQSIKDGSADIDDIN